MPIVRVQAEGDLSTSRKCMQTGATRFREQLIAGWWAAYRDVTMCRSLGSSPASAVAGKRGANAALRPIQEVVAANIGGLKEVVKVTASVDEDGVIGVCTIIDSGDRNARYLVYEAERSLMIAFPSDTFDFRVVDLKSYAGASIEALSEVEGEVLYDKTGAGSSDRIYVDPLGSNDCIVCDFKTFCSPSGAKSSLTGQLRLYLAELGDEATYGWIVQTSREEMEDVSDSSPYAFVSMAQLHWASNAGVQHGKPGTRFHSLVDIDSNDLAEDHLCAQIR